MVAEEYGVQTIREVFAEDVALVMDVAESDYFEFSSRLAELSSGSIVPVIEEKKLAARPCSGGQL
jgi:hypothetical protein